ncbi:aldehyde dehydrogenase family protein [Arsenicitalea aurantiaca]|nr:aldehyde dehydrogenase family protein [Arsenicitalea aurantiaca]
MTAYLRPRWEAALRAGPDTADDAGGPAAEPADPLAHNVPAPAASGLDRTAKLYIGGRQVRPDGGYSRPVLGPDGALVGEVGEANRKDVRNAVEKARPAAAAWGAASGHARAQILYFLAENLDYRREEFARRLTAQTGADAGAAEAEVTAAIDRLFVFAGWADKYEGVVHNPPMRAVAAAMVEPLGVIGIVAPRRQPLLGAVALLAPALAMGNAAVLVPSDTAPLSMTDFYQLLETSDVPGGVLNILTGDPIALGRTLAEHDGVEALWYCGPQAGVAPLERASTGNLKQTWTAPQADLSDPARFETQYLLQKATQIKNIWIPYGA